MVCFCFVSLGPPPAAAWWWVRSPNYNNSNNFCNVNTDGSPNNNNANNANGFAPILKIYRLNNVNFEENITTFFMRRNTFCGFCPKWINDALCTDAACMVKTSVYLFLFHVQGYAVCLSILANIFVYFVLKLVAIKLYVGRILFLK